MTEINNDIFIMPIFISYTKIKFFYILFSYIVCSWGYRKPTAKIYEVKAKMSVWKPKVAHVGEFSLGQIWLTAGSYTTNDLNTIEAGWQVRKQILLLLVFFFGKDYY